MEWISVKDRMPEDLKPVLIHYKDKTGIVIMTAHWDDLNSCFVNEAIGFMCPEDDDFLGEKLCYKKRYITHWMEFPELPKE
jgi:hypothetical protein